ncbi:hypothetical protein [Marisediminicola sp. LYQ134]|uniref:hypothetical protein n=1 Tax=unclassified Marisediminicola TaxID=2618316 RepID=UPI003983CF9D
MTDDDQDLPRGWIALQPHHWSRAWLGFNAPMAALAVVQMPFVVWHGGRALGGSYLLVFALVILTLVVVFLTTTVIMNRRWPIAEINLDTSELRAGSRVVGLADVDRAMLAAWSVKKVRAVKLRLTGAGARAEVTVRSRRGALLDDTATRVLAEALRRTAVELPKAKEDPTGRFARYNFPTNITRDEAVAIALNPPTVDDRLPIPS